MLGLPDSITALLFDLDGVLTETAKVHAKAWAEAFDELLKARAGQGGDDYMAFDPVGDYDEYVDGKPRYDGVRSFLGSRGIELPEGKEDDPPGLDTVHAVGNLKNGIVLKLIEKDGVAAYEGSRRYLEAVAEAGLARAVVSSSTNCRAVLQSAGIAGFFETIVDGAVAEREEPRASRHRTRSLRGRGCWASPPCRRSSSRTRSRASRPVMTAISATSSASTGPARRRSSAATARRSSSRDLAELLEHP